MNNKILKKVIYIVIHAMVDIENIKTNQNSPTMTISTISGNQYNYHSSDKNALS